MPSCGARSGGTPGRRPCSRRATPSWVHPPPCRVDYLRAMLAMDLADGCRAIPAPTTVVVGSRDGLTPPALSRRLAATIPGSRLVEVKGAGHMLPYEATGLLADLIGRYPVMIVDLRRRAAARRRHADRRDPRRRPRSGSSPSPPSSPSAWRTGAEASSTRSSSSPSGARACPRGRRSRFCIAGISLLIAVWGYYWDVSWHIDRGPRPRGVRQPGALVHHHRPRRHRLRRDPRLLPRRRPQPERGAPHRRAGRCRPARSCSARAA